jgi:hypothetical protein
MVDNNASCTTVFGIKNEHFDLSAPDFTHLLQVLPAVLLVAKSPNGRRFH